MTFNFKKFVKGVVLCGFVSLLIGCTSTEDRFKKGAEAQMRGDYLEAIEQFLKVLESEPQFPEARERLIEVGRIFINDQLSQAVAYDADGDFIGAAESYRTVDDLITQANMQAQVQFALPDTYDPERRLAFNKAIDQVIEVGDRDMLNGHYEEALRLFESGLHYEPDTNQTTELLEAQARTLLRWGDADLDKGEFRAAHARAARIFELVPPDSRLGESARALQADAVQLGTRPVIMLPLWRTEPMVELMPEGFLDDLNDVLQAEYWDQPPLFIATENAAIVRREVRRMGYNRRLINTAQATEIGRALGARYVVGGELVFFEGLEDRVRETQEELRTRNNQIVPYTRRRGEFKITVKVTYAVFDVEFRRQVQERTETITHSTRYERGLYDGDLAELDLSRGQRRLFDPDEWQALQRDVETVVIDEMAERLGNRIYDFILRQVR